MSRWSPLAVVAALIVAAFVLIACGGDGRDQPALSDVTPQPGRLPTHTPPPTFITSANAGATLVYLLDDNLWVAPLDGSGEPRAITSGSFGARYAGYALQPDGGIDFYYLSQLEENRELFDEVEFGVYRVGLEGGEAEELFRFSSDSAHLVGADVAPDGLRIVYADVDALILRDLVSGEETILARSRWILAGDGSYIRTNMLTSPIWSPTGEQVYSSMFAGPDTVVSVIIDLPPRPITVVDIRYPGHRGTWSPDGSQLCLTSGDIYDGGLTLYDVTSHEQSDVLASGVLPDLIEGQKSSVSGCAWSEDGRLAAGYTPIEREPHRIFILDEQLALLDQSELFTPSPGVIDWLPDGSGVVVERRNMDGESFSAGIYRPGAGIEYLPFEADRVIAVIP